MLSLKENSTLTDVHANDYIYNQYVIYNGANDHFMIAHW